ALHSAGGMNDRLAIRGMHNTSEYVRAWSVQLIAEDRSVSKEVLQEMVKLAGADSSPVVRLYLASAATRLPLVDSTEITSRLVQHAEDASDHNLPLLYWY